MEYVWCSLLVVTLSFALTDDCGICACSPSRDRIVCAGKGFTAPPDLPREALENAIGLGLQRNAIATIPAAFLNSFKKVEVVDLRGQRTEQGCVLITGRVRKSIQILGRICPRPTPRFPPPADEEEDEEDDEDEEDEEEEVQPTTIPDSVTTTMSVASSSITEETTEATEMTSLSADNEAVTIAEMIPRPAETDDTILPIISSSSTAFYVTLSIFSVAVIILGALLVASYRSRFSAWLWKRRYVTTKLRRSPPPTTTTLGVETLGSLGHPPALMMPYDEDEEMETVFELPKVLVHSSPQAIATISSSSSPHLGVVTSSSSITSSSGKGKQRLAAKPTSPSDLTTLRRSKRLSKKHH